MPSSGAARSRTVPTTDDRPIVELGPSAARQWLDAPEHLAMVLSRYRAASALIGSARTVLELGCGEGIGAGIVASGRASYVGVDRDDAAIDAALRSATGRDSPRVFVVGDALEAGPIATVYDAVVALDVIEHMTTADGRLLVERAASLLTPHGVLVVGTPSARFDHLASAQSRREHLRTYTWSELEILIGARFHVVQSFGMQDTALHLGHPDARHYLMVTGICPR